MLEYSISALNIGNSFISEGFGARTLVETIRKLQKRTEEALVNRMLPKEQM